ncbi:MAG: FISUMP domain-containing protein [Rhodobacter sp.]|nr:FISUMP domain-containing protein [Rhodobacter sp.]
MTEITTNQGNTYRLVEIGNQCWFADNLKEIPTNPGGWYGYYGNATEERNLGEGLLYTWKAAMNGEAEEGARGTCPIGWHIPIECELRMVENNLEFVPSSFPGRTTLDAEGEMQIKTSSFTGRGYLFYLWSSTDAQDGPSVLWQVRRRSASVINGNPKNTYSARCIRD